MPLKNVTQIQLSQVMSGKYGTSSNATNNTIKMYDIYTIRMRAIIKYVTKCYI